MIMTNDRSSILHHSTVMSPGEARVSKKCLSRCYSGPLPERSTSGTQGSEDFDLRISSGAWPNDVADVGTSVGARSLNLEVPITPSSVMLGLVHRSLGILTYFRVSTLAVCSLIMNAKKTRAREHTTLFRSLYIGFQSPSHKWHLHISSR